MTDIEWAANADGTKGKAWNPVLGCSLASEGCRNCYAMKFAHRGLTERHRGLTVMGQHGPRWTGEVRLVPEALGTPLKWRKPQVVFVNSMSDLFHEKVPLEYILQVLTIMQACPQHTFIVLTKRAKRMREVMSDAALPDELMRLGEDLAGKHQWCHAHEDRDFPLDNIVLGVSVESADWLRRIEWLLQTPAATRIVSLEPLLGPVQIDTFLGDLPEDNDGAPYPGRIDGVIVGGESGPGARPCNVEWIRDIVRQCRESGTHCFVKQLGANPVFESSWSDADPVITPEDGTGDLVPIKLNDRKGADPSEWPSDLRVRELPY